MGLFGAFKGAPKDEKKKESDTWQNLNNLFGSTYGHSEQIGQKGIADQADAAGFFKGVLRGDRTAIAPGTNAAINAGDAAKREQAQMGTARGGGAVGANQQIEAHTRQLLSSLLGEQQTAAAGALATIGNEEMGHMGNLLNTASGTETNLSNILHQDVREKDQSAAKMWGSLLKGGLNLATAGMSGGFGGLFGGGGGGGDMASIPDAPNMISTGGYNQI
jgi:hypothetical protein